MDTTLTRRQLVRWRTAIFTIFFVTGLGFISWASRLPAVKTGLGINDFEVGVLLFISGAAAIVGLSLANLIVARWGARRGMFGTVIAFSVGIAVVGLGVQFADSYVITAIGLALMGLGMSATDVMMNVEAAAVEQSFGKTLMPLFHAFFSLGTVVGAAIGVVMAAWNIGVAWHLWGIGILVVAAGLFSLGAVPTREIVHDDPANPTTRSERFREVAAVWRDPRTYTLGVIMLGMAFAEGSANDWLTIAWSTATGRPKPVARSRSRCSRSR